MLRVVANMVPWHVGAGLDGASRTQAFDMMTGSNACHVEQVCVGQPRELAKLTKSVELVVSGYEQRHAGVANLLPISEGWSLVM